MKKTTVFAAFLLTLALLMTACAPASPGGAAEAPDEIVVYNWGLFMDESLNREFTEQTGIRVIYRTFATNEALYAALRGGGARYDVIVPSDYMIGRLIAEDMLYPLNFDNIPNFANVKPQFKNPEYDPENLFSVPYMWGTVGLIYNTTKVSGPVDSWGALFDEQYAGEILMFSNARDAFAIALKVLGYSLNTTDTDQLRRAYELLREQRPLVQRYVMDEIFDLLVGGEAILGPYYAGDGLSMMAENPDLNFVVPREGTNVFVDAFAVPKGARNRAGAEAYINFMTSKAAGLRNAEYIGYSTPLQPVYDALPDEVRDDGVSYPDFDDPRFETFVNLPQEILDWYDRHWTSLLG